MSVPPCQIVADSLPKGDQGQNLVTVGFYVTLYFGNGYLPERRCIAYELFREYWSWCGGELRWTTNIRTHVWQPVTPKHSPEAWLRVQPSEAWVWGITYHGGAVFDAASAFRIDAVGSGDPATCYNLSYFNVTFPITWFEHQNEDAPALFLRWCQMLKPLHGSAGFAIVAPLAQRTESAAAGSVAALARRFPGLEIDNPLSHSLYLLNGIKSANWLQCLDDALLARLGGVAAIRERLDSDLFLYEYPGGAVLQAGLHPETGDANQRIVPQAYRKAAAVLAPVQSEYLNGSGHPVSILGFDEAGAHAWLHRFD